MVFIRKPVNHDMLNNKGRMSSRQLNWPRVMKPTRSDKRPISSRWWLGRGSNMSRLAIRNLEFAQGFSGLLGGRLLLLRVARGCIVGNNDYTINNNNSASLYGK